MKLDEAMMLGMCRFNLYPQSWQCEDGGCLLAVAALAVGRRHPNAYELIMELWPWLGERFPVPEWLMVPCPPILRLLLLRHPGADGHSCNNRDQPSFADGEQVGDDIISVAAYYVKSGQIQLETVLDWIRSVQPEEADAENDEGRKNSADGQALHRVADCPVEVSAR
jgi:hypothetical protein